MMRARKKPTRRAWTVGRATYPFAALPGLARLVEAAPRLSDDEQYRLSLQIEPRGRPPT